MIAVDGNWIGNVQVAQGVMYVRAPFLESELGRMDADPCSLHSLWTPHNRQYPPAQVVRVVRSQKSPPRATVHNFITLSLVYSWAPTTSGGSCAKIGWHLQRIRVHDQAILVGHGRPTGGSRF